MTDSGDQCPQCGGPVSPAAVEGLCARCLLRRALDLEETPPDAPAAGEATADDLNEAPEQNGSIPPHEAR